MQYIIREKVFNYDSRIFSQTKCSAGIHSDLIKSVKELGLLAIVEHELWDTMYASLDEYEEEITTDYNNGFNFQQLASTYGIPDFLIKMKLNGELEDDE